MAAEKRKTIVLPGFGEIRLPLAAKQSSSVASIARGIVYDRNPSTDRAMKRLMVSLEQKQRPGGGDDADDFGEAEAADDAAKDDPDNASPGGQGESWSRLEHSHE